MGADPSKKNRTQQTPDQAAIDKPLPLYSLLAKARHRQEGLLSSLQDGDFATAKEQIEEDANVYQTNDNSDSTLLLAIRGAKAFSVKRHLPLNEDSLLEVMRLIYAKAKAGIANAETSSSSSSSVSPPDLFRQLVDRKNKQDETALSLARKEGLNKIVDFLKREASAGADELDILSPIVNSPLLIDILHDNPGQLAEIASSPYTDFTLVQSKNRENPEKKNIFHYCALSKLSVFIKDIQAGLQLLTTDNPTVLKAINVHTEGREKTPLHLVASRQSLVAKEIAQTLLELGADPSLINASNETPDKRALRRSYKNNLESFVWTPRFEMYFLLADARHRKEGSASSLRDGNFKVARELIEKGENPEQTDEINNTLVILAIKGAVWLIEKGILKKEECEQKLLDFLKMINKKILINQQSSVSLSSEVLEPAVPTIKFFDRKNKMQETPLLLAIEHQFFKIVDFLLFHVDVDTSLKNSTGDTVLHIIAAKQNINPDIVTLLLLSAAHELETKNNRGEVPLHLVQNPSVCTLFCKLAPQLIHEKDASGRTPEQRYEGAKHGDQLRRIVSKCDSNQPATEIPKTLQQRAKAMALDMTKDIDLPTTAGLFLSVTFKAFTEGTLPALKELGKWGASALAKRISKEENKASENIDQVEK